MANYEHVKKFCERVVNLQKTHSNEIRLTREEAVSIMCELNQMLINESTKISQPVQATQKIVSDLSLDAGSFKD
jgi:hypothetical protein